VRQCADFRHGCDGYTENTSSGRFARRSRLRSAIFGAGAWSEGDPWAPRPPRERKALAGIVADVGPHVIILQTPGGEERLILPADARSCWRGSAVPASAIKHGDQVIVRKASPGRAERVWAQIGRVTGTIIDREGREMLVDEGPAKGRKIVIIREGSIRAVQVRFPRMEPGYLIDVIGLRQEEYLLGLTPATAQPPYRAGHPPAPPLVSGHVPDRIHGTVAWHEPSGEPPDLLGLAYPALDPETNCEHAPPRRREPFVVDAHTVGPGCVRLPYLSVGSAVKIHNECSGRGGVLPVTSCGAPSRLFCDRCVECGTSPRGRIADLTAMAFVELGGNLEEGCFNATLAVPV
jgi:hypothetical protein